MSPGVRGKSGMRASVMHGMKNGFMGKVKINIIWEAGICVERMVQKELKIEDCQTEKAASILSLIETQVKETDQNSKETKEEPYKQDFISSSIPLF